MIKKIVYLLLALFTNNTLAAPPHSFTQAKKIARSIFSKHRQTLYCQCNYDKYNHIDLASCGMKTAKNRPRANQTEWEHIVPASFFGSQLACWNKPLCQKQNGKTYKGRRCCRKINLQFRYAEAELYNLWPADGLINQLRANYPYASLPYGTTTYGCNFIVDKLHSQIEPNDYAKGIVARASLFFSDKYQLALANSQRQLYMLWSQLYPPSQWEQQWASQVAQIEGYNNPYITDHFNV